MLTTEFPSRIRRRDPFRFSAGRHADFRYGGRPAQAVILPGDAQAQTAEPASPRFRVVRRRVFPTSMIGDEAILRGRLQPVAAMQHGDGKQQEQHGIERGAFGDICASQAVE